MKKKYSDTLPMLKELFSDWTDEDLIFALEDADGDLEAAIDRISEGLLFSPYSNASLLAFGQPLTLVRVSTQAMSLSGVR